MSIPLVDRSTLPDGQLPLSYQQEQMLLLSQLATSKASLAAYNTPLAMDLQGDLDQEALMGAMRVGGGGGGLGRLQLGASPRACRWWVTHTQFCRLLCALDLDMHALKTWWVSA
jgi:hypothetical protein